jgi:hypothetical protein
MVSDSADRQVRRLAKSLPSAPSLTKWERSFCRPTRTEVPPHLAACRNRCYNARSSCELQDSVPAIEDNRAIRELASVARVERTGIQAHSAVDAVLLSRSNTLDRPTILWACRGSAGRTEMG